MVVECISKCNCHAYLARAFDFPSDCRLVDSIYNIRVRVYNVQYSATLVNSMACQRANSWLHSASQWQMKGDSIINNLFWRAASNRFYWSSASNDMHKNMKHLLPSPPCQSVLLFFLHLLHLARHRFNSVVLCTISAHSDKLDDLDGLLVYLFIYKIFTVHKYKLCSLSNRSPFTWLNWTISIQIKQICRKTV